MRQTVYYVEGDGIGPEIWRAARLVLDAAVARAYGPEQAIDWRELLAGEKALAETGELLPQTTLDTLRTAGLAIKGPLSTPVGTGFRSLNVTLRQVLDLYACIRPVRWYPGVEAPVKRPELVDMVIFRENTEDLYLGIEFAAQTPEAKKLAAYLRDELGVSLDPATAIGIKPMSEKNTRRLVRRAVQYALDHGRPSVTLMHKGNIMKHTEGAFREWGYKTAREEFPGRCVIEEEAAPGQVLVKDMIADALFQSVLLHPERYSVIAAPNLNGDYLSDALAAQVGGLGIAPGVNMSDSLAFFEATHGTAPRMAGKDSANPCSLILSGAMMLEHMGLPQAAARIHNALVAVLASRQATKDLAAEMPGGKTVGCRQFAELLAEAL